MKNNLIQINSAITRLSHTQHPLTSLPHRYLVDFISDQTGMKGTGRWTIQEAAERSVPVPTMAAALDARYVRLLCARMHFFVI